MPRPLVKGGARSPTSWLPGVSTMSFKSTNAGLGWVLAFAFMAVVPACSGDGGNEEMTDYDPVGANTGGATDTTGGSNSSPTNGASNGEQSTTGGDTSASNGVD